MVKSRNGRRQRKLIGALLLIALGVWLAVYLLPLGDMPDDGTHEAMQQPSPGSLRAGANGDDNSSRSVRSEIPDASPVSAPKEGDHGSVRIELRYADGTPGAGLVLTIAPFGLGDRHQPAPAPTSAS